MSRKKKAEREPPDPRIPWMYPKMPPAWPPYCPRPKERVLAVMLGDGSILAETGEKWWPETWQDMASLLFQQNLQLFIGPVKDACRPWQQDLRAELIGEKAGKLAGGWSVLDYSRNKQVMTGVKVHRKWPDTRGRMRWQVRNMTVSSAWTRTIEPELLLDLRYLFDLLQTGVVATPGAAGYATMARFWKGKPYSEMKRHFRPPLSLIQDLQEQAIGSRRETYRPLEVFDHAYELDRSSGFAAETGELPAGGVLYLPVPVAHNELYHLEDSPKRECFTWWGRCLVKILHDLPMGDVAPFAVRNPQTDELEWPTTAGSYPAYLWKHEADEIQQRFQNDGSMVVLSIFEAWVWMDSTTQLAAWREYMDGMRREARYGEGGSKARADLVKLCIVAGIGRLGLPYEYNEILTQGEKDSIPLDGAGLFDEPLYLTTHFQDVGTPKHWQCFILSKMNQKLYQVLRWGYLNSIGTVASNVDSVVFESDPGWGVEPAAATVGEFKRQSLGNWCAVPKAGYLLSPTKTTTPGMPLRERQRIMRIGEHENDEERRRRNKSAPRRAFRDRMQVMMNYTEIDPKKIKDGKAKIYTLKEEIQQLEQLRRFMLKVGAGSG